VVAADDQLATVTPAPTPLRRPMVLIMATEDLVLELMTTVVAHFEHAGFQLQPFLIIGIISGVRHILTVGARLSLAGEVTGTAFRQSQIELGVEAAVVLGLGVALFLVRLRSSNYTEFGSRDPR